MKPAAMQGELIGQKAQGEPLSVDSDSLRARQMGSAVLDQGLFAGTHFALNVLLARWLPPDEYGAFVTAYSVFILLAILHTTFLTEPMLIFGAGKYAGEFRGYLRRLLRAHVGLTLALSGLIGVLGAVAANAGLMGFSGALYGLAVANPALLLLWLLRRAFYVKKRAERAALGGAAYLLLALGGIALLSMMERLSAFSALLVMGGAGLLVGLGFCLALRLARPQPFSTRFGQMLGEHFRYMRWAMGATGLAWSRTRAFTCCWRCSAASPGAPSSVCWSIWRCRCCTPARRCRCRFCRNTSALPAAARPACAPQSDERC